MEFDELMRSFARSLGLDSISPVSDGEYKLVFDDVLEMRFLRDTQGALIVYGFLGGLPDEARSRLSLLQGMLKANVGYSVLSANAVLSLDMKTEEIVLSQKLDFRSLSTQAMSEVVEKFLNRLEYWKDHKDGTDQTSRMSPFFMFP